MSIENFDPETASKAIAAYQHWFGIPTFLRCPHQPDLKDTDIGLIGVPYSGGNAIERMQYLGPRTIRNRSSSYGRSHRNFRINPFELARIRDLGDVALPRGLNPDMSAEDTQAYFEKVFKAGIITVSVGGDHSITWPALRAARATKFSEPVGIVRRRKERAASMVCPSGPTMTRMAEVVPSAPGGRSGALTLAGRVVSDSGAKTGMVF